MSKEYYNILGINKGASDDEIKKAYRKKAMEFHPDKILIIHKQKINSKKLQKLMMFFQILKRNQTMIDLEQQTQIHLAVEVEIHLVDLVTDFLWMIYSHSLEIFSDKIKVVEVVGLKRKEKVVI